MSDSIHPKTNQKSTFTFHGRTQVPRVIATKVHEIVKNRMKTTEAIEPPDPIPVMEYKNIRLGKLLGTGSFSSAFLAESSSSPEGPLVMKKLRPEVLKNPLVFAACAADLYQEGKILASVDHPNIIRLRAWSGPQMIQRYLDGSHVSAYLILDQLEGTLEERFGQWAKRKPKFYHSKKRRIGVLSSIQHEKCQHILSLARALEHLHGYHILHRDIKAANIGFDSNGTLKIFDFDLARVLPLGRHQLFQLTANVGSPRYMAPEVKRGDKYNLTADVFSFGVLVYQIFTLKKFRSPETMDCNWEATNKSIPFGFSADLRNLLQQCLLEKNTVRPHMDQVRSMLQAEIEGEHFDLDAMTEITGFESMSEMENSGQYQPLPAAPSNESPFSEEVTNARSKDDEEKEEVAKPTTSVQTNTILWVTYLNIVLYALCYQLQRPVEPFLVQSLIDKQSEDSGNGGEHMQVSRAYGNLQSFFQAIQTVGSPLVGILLDRLGIQKTSALVFLASGLSYALLAMATDMTSLFLSKLPTVLMAAFLVAQATATTTLQADFGNSASAVAAARAAALGRMTTAYTIGATLGPTIGGNLANQGDYSIGAKLAVAGSVVSVVLSLWFLPDTAKVASESKGEKLGPKSGSSFLEQLKHSGSLLVRSGLWPLLMIKVVGGIIASMHSTSMPLIMTNELKLEPSQLGLVMSSSMFVVAAFGAVAMAPLTQKLHNARFFGMIQIGLLLRAVMGCGMAWIVSSIGSSVDEETAVLYNVITVAVFHALASHTLATGLTTQTTGMVSKEEQGALLGLEHGLFSLARIVGPTIGTRLLEWGGLWSVEITCGFFDVILVVLSVVLIVTKEKSL
ncbi:unnamed protein product [Cylindrotheca closterium]|uniref:Protein kinase domain-containing protein n=1 Tax=Cylindrotheca closterium TaxID=2856 RepID=A0AAD2PX99_9STRA|nr:unnamed protein product [Cylindrotheca closterium]